jgi:biopolymer transport protein ExbD
VDEELLTQLLEEAATRQEQPVIRLRADRSIQYQRVVDVIDMIKKAGLAKLDIDTQAGGR